MKQTSLSTTGYYEIKQTLRGGEWYWIFKANNHETIAISPYKLYSSFLECAKAAYWARHFSREALILNEVAPGKRYARIECVCAYFVVELSKNSEYYWKLEVNKPVPSTLAISSEGYFDSDSCIHAIRLLQSSNSSRIYYEGEPIDLLRMTGRIANLSLIAS